MVDSKYFKWAIGSLFITFAFAQISRRVDCSHSPVDVIFLIDVTTDDDDGFQGQQEKIIETIRHLDNVSAARDTLYGIISFHQRPVVLLSLGSSISKSAEKVTALVDSLQPRTKSDSSPAKALEVAIDHFTSNGRTGARKLIVIAHDGLSTDLIAETIEARNRVDQQEASVFSVAGSESANIAALTGYTRDRARIYFSRDDEGSYFKEMDLAIGVCTDRTSDVGRKKGSAAFGVRSRPASSVIKASGLNEACASNKIDLMVVLDTSGSVFNAFAEERKLARDLITSIEPSAFEDGRLQVSIVRFASSPQIAIPFVDGRSKDDVLTRINEIEFTGSNTRIAEAIDLALAELTRARRADATQVFVLITDGHGQEFWNVVQATGKKLQSSGAEIFSVTTSRDYNFAELMLYAGDDKRVFVGPKYTSFVPTVSPLLNKCLRGDLKMHVPAKMFVPEITAIERLSTVEPTEGTNTSISKIVPENQLPAVALSEDREQCEIDLLFVIDRSTSVAAEFGKQLKFATDLVEKLLEEDLNGRRVRIAAISFARDARVEIEFGKAKNKSDVVKKIRDIKHTGGETSAVTGVALATKFAQSTRRPNARLMFVLISDGNSQDVWKNVMREAKILHGIPNIDVYTATFSNKYSFEELQAFAGDERRMFVGARARLFIRDAEKQLNSCPGISQNVTKQNEVDSGVDKAEQFSTCNDQVDLIIAIDNSSPALSSFETSKKIVKELINSAPASDFGSRIHTALISFGAKTRLMIPLKSAASRDEILLAVEKIEKLTGETSIASGLAFALSEIKSNHRDDTRLIVVLLSNGGSKDLLVVTNATAAALQGARAEVYAVAVTGGQNDDELLTYARDVKRVFSGFDWQERELINSVALSSCFAMDFAEKSHDDVDPTKEREEETQKLLTENIIPSSIQLPTVANLPRKVTAVNSDCEVDLMFIIDRSQSVEKAFQKQLQFAVDLVKRMPSTDFATRVRVAAVSFHSSAKLEFPFDRYGNQSEILDALLAIEHTGGSTSAVSGVNRAVDEIEKTARKGVRKMVVLISDGNSQDSWTTVLSAANRLRAADVDVYAVTVSHDYYFRELELYAGNKWLVYIDARIRQFLDEAELSVAQCRGPAIPVSTLPPKGESEPTTPVEQIVMFTGANDLAVEGFTSPTSTDASTVSRCSDDRVDVLIILDTSTSVENEFYAEKNFALDLVKVFPEADFENRILVALVRFAGTAKLQFGFGDQKTRGDVLYELERVEHTGGQTSLVAAVNVAMKEIAARHRQDARLVIVIVSDGNSQDDWPVVQSTAKKLRKSGGEVYAVTLSEKYYFGELKEYTGEKEHVYIDDRINKFIQDVGASVLTCAGEERVTVTKPATEEVRVTPLSKVTSGRITEFELTKPHSKLNGEKAESQLAKNELAKDALPVVAVRDSKPIDANRCKYSKMDLEIILDASSSRQEVFEHQRELALSLIERLPIDSGETHVAVGINSFTQVPTLRQTLGLGRDKQMVRRAIEDIKYRGGSTLTAEAVELSVQDLERGKRPDAIQVVVLMNDGMSQDAWERVLKASEKLKSTGAERFGVALGDNVDLRELELYIGDEKRIYRDGSTERFLSDVVSLLTGGEGCPVPGMKHSQLGSTNDCKTPNLDIVVAFDNSDGTSNLSDPSVSSNRYLLLDVLGSLPANGERIKLIIVSFANDPDLIIGLKDNQERESVFRKVEGIKAQQGKPAYAKAIDFALDEYERSHRPNARGLFLIVGDGRTSDVGVLQNSTVSRIRKQQGLSCYAVDSGKSVNDAVLGEYTGSRKRVYNYDRNAEFAKTILREATASDNCEQATKTAASHEESRLRDIAGKVDNGFKEFEGEKAVIKEATARTTKRITPWPTVNLRRSRTTKSLSSLRTTTQRAGRSTTLRSQATIRVTRSTTSRSTLTTRSPTPTRSTSLRSTTPLVTEANTPFTPGCLLDVLIIIDSSGSVEETFVREKELAAGIIERLRIGPNNAHVALIKFAAKEKVKTVWSLGSPQSKAGVLRALQSIEFSSGTTAIHTALLQAITEYTPLKGARPGRATPIGIIFTDGFGQKDTTEAAELLRAVVPNMFAVAINHQYPISRKELERIAGSPKRVFTDSNIPELHSMLDKFKKSC